VGLHYVLLRILVLEVVEDLGSGRFPEIGSLMRVFRDINCAAGPWLVIHLSEKALLAFEYPLLHLLYLLLFWSSYGRRPHLLTHLAVLHRKS